MKYIFKMTLFLLLAMYNNTQLQGAAADEEPSIEQLEKDYLDLLKINNLDQGSPEYRELAKLSRALYARVQDKKFLASPGFKEAEEKSIAFKEAIDACVIPDLTDDTVKLLKQIKIGGGPSAEYWFDSKLKEVAPAKKPLSDHNKAMLKKLAQQDFQVYNSLMKARFNESYQKKVRSSFLSLIHETKDLEVMFALHNLESLFALFQDAVFFEGQTTLGGICRISPIKH